PIVIEGRIPCLLYNSMALGESSSIKALYGESFLKLSLANPISSNSVKYLCTFSFSFSLKDNLFSISSKFISL
ncbi:MAG TPA: hypothetical protein DIU45_04480, partial [Clostridium sp.]|nr:hypothetical protein [Clostridium sp.]